VTYHPTCHSLRMLRVGDKPLRLLRTCAGWTWSSCRRRPVLRLRRHVRAEERRHLDGDAGRQDAARLSTGAEVCTAGDSSCLMHIGGGLSRMRTGVRTCTWPRSSPPRGATPVAAARPGRRSTATPSGSVPMSTFLGMPSVARTPKGVGHLQGDESFPTPPARAGRHPAAPQHRPGDHDHPRQARRVVAEVPDWEELREAGRTLKAATMARLPELLEQLEERVTAPRRRRALGPRRGEANAIVTDLVQATGADEVVKVKSMATQEIGLNEALEAAGIARSRPTSPSSSCSSATTSRRTSWSRRSTATGRDPRHLPARDAGTGHRAPRT
jgi:hypothetical protein